MKTVVVGMSGGVDSSVTAAMLVDRGHQVVGVTLQTWETEDDATTSKKWQERGCCKIGIARYVAERLHIAHRVIDIREHFRSAVVQDFIDGYRSGQTPNPCVRCNERVKFGCLVDAARELGADAVATGHYAQVVPDAAGRPHLHKGGDPKKDQSYFLYRLNRRWLAGILFPVGGMRKDEVWRKADEIGLPADEVKESQEICFVTKGDYRSFLEQEAPQIAQRGAFVGTDGTVLGTHRGVPFYTPGQRRGLGLSAEQRLYVVRVDAATNTVVVGREEELLASACVVGDLNLLSMDCLAEPVRADVKVRYASPAVPATIGPLEEGRVRIEFDEPQRALSPGQSAVFYQGDLVLGGGIIEATNGKG
jgi:tRNA-uridine 2-sulfurtransferase